MKRELSVHSHIYGCSDVWSSRVTDSYIMATYHFITRDWKLKRFAVAFDKLEGKHSPSVLVVPSLLLPS